MCVFEAMRSKRSPADRRLKNAYGSDNWTRESVYIANILKSRPPGNRNPEPDEIAARISP